MFGGDSQTFHDTVDLVEQWIPEKKYRSERKFRDDLQEYLDERLNSQSGGMMGGGQDHVVTVEHGQVNADVCVDGKIGIELKRDLSNSQTKKLRGQIDAYLDHYPFVIGCACGIDDMDGWRTLKNRFEQSGGMGAIGMDQSEVVLIHKPKEHFGKDPRDVDRGGGFFGGGGGGIF
jgi:hypothetical protein